MNRLTTAPELAVKIVANRKHAVVINLADEFCNINIWNYTIY